MSTITETSGAEAVLAGNRRKECAGRGWMLAELAARSGVSRAMLSKIERWAASPTTMRGRLPAAFGLTIS